MVKIRYYCYRAWLSGFCVKVAEYIQLKTAFCRFAMMIYEKGNDENETVFCIDFGYEYVDVPLPRNRGGNRYEEILC